MSNKKWRDDVNDKITFRTPNFEAHTVNEKVLHFFPVSVSVLFKLRSLAKPLGLAIRTLFSQHTNDTGQTHRSFADPKNKDSVSTEFVIAPIAPEIAKLRAEQGEKALGNLIETLLDEKNADVLGELLVDSLREVFTTEIRKGMSSTDYCEFVRDMDIITKLEMLKGLAKGNKKILGPFGDLLGASFGQMLSGVAGVVDKMTATSSPSLAETKSS